MQGRHWNPNDGRAYNDGRGYNSNYRNFNRSGSSNFGRGQPLPPPRRSKEEIFMEAGRLAAEYLVYKGLLPASSLPPKGQNGRLLGFKEHDRDLTAPDGRTSSLNRLGNMNSDASNVMRRYNDDYDERMGPMKQFRGKKRMGPYGREYGSDWGRENNGRWMERNRGYNDMEDEDDFAHGYQRDRRSGFDQLPSRRENTWESGSENHDFADDTISKGSSSSARRDPLSEMDGDLSKYVADDSKGMNSEAGDEVKMDASRDSNKKNVVEESVLACETEGDSKNGDDLVKLCTFARVPTRPRSSAAQKSPKMEQGITLVASNTVEGGSSGEQKVTLGEDIAGDSSNSLPTNQTDLKIQAHAVPSPSSVQLLLESVEKQHEGSQNLPRIGYLEPVVDEAEGTDERGGMKRQRDPSPEDEFSKKHNLRAKLSSHEVEKSPVDEDKVGPVTVKEELHADEEAAAPIAIHQEIPFDDALTPKLEPELGDKMEEGKQLLSASFKICDLNLMQAHEITEIPNDPDPDHLHPSASMLETGKELSMDFALSICNNSNVADHLSRLSDDDKVVQVIDLGDDPPIDASDTDPVRPKDEPMYPNLDNFLNQPEHADLSGVQDGYSLAISEFYGSDISQCPSVPSDLSSLQTGMSLHDAEGVPNDDDSIYVSLGEIPIGFMEVWDPPPQEYGKFF